MIFSPEYNLLYEFAHLQHKVHKFHRLKKLIPLAFIIFALITTLLNVNKDLIIMYICLGLYFIAQIGLNKKLVDIESQLLHTKNHILDIDNVTIENMLNKIKCNLQGLIKAGEPKETVRINKALTNLNNIKAHDKHVQINMISHAYYEYQEYLYMIEAKYF